MRRLPMLTLIALLPAVAAAHEDGDARAHYLANEGVMLEHAGRKVLFDPLFNEAFGQYRLLPEDMRDALFAGEPPWDGVDAVFISHYHDDHFAPADMRDYLRTQPQVRLYAPRQAVEALRATAPDDAALAARITAVDLEYGDEPQSFAADGLAIDAVRIPHSGWPTRRLEVQNIAWRVTLDDAVTVVHLGDADTRDLHYEQDEEYWLQKRLQLALPPYWYFLSAAGRDVLENRLRPEHAIGIHVPVSISGNPNERDPELAGADLFTRPGETRLLPHSH